MTTVRRGSGTLEMGWVSVICGVVAVLVSPAIWVLLGYSIVLCGTLIVSLVLALIAFIFGILAAVKRDQLGYVGIILAVVAGILILVPVLYVMAAPLD